MGIALLGLTVIVAIVNLVCFIIVLIKLFAEEGAGKGILGLICGIYTFYWGWQNADRQNIRTVMTVWTVGVVLSLFSNFAARALA